MPLTELQHYFVRVNDLERSRRFYCDVLGFELMPRPDFPFPGYWLGVNGKVQIHMGLHGVENSALYYLGTSPRSATDNSGVVDHIAFIAKDPQQLGAHLLEKGVPTRKRYFPEFRLFQMLLRDPDGLTIELNFEGVEDVGAWGADSENYADMARAATTPAP